MPRADRPDAPLFASRLPTSPGGAQRSLLAPAAIRKIANRDQFLAGLFILISLNGLAAPVAESIRSLGLSDALLATFNVSALVWVACAVAPALLLGGQDDDEITGADVAVGLLVLAAAVVPLGKLSWLAATGLALYTLWAGPTASRRRRCALVLLAVTGPMLWGPLLMTIVGQPVLRADALIVSSLIGTERIGNVVRFAGDAGTFQITPGCSSLQGISLALLAWVTISQVAEHAWSRRDLVWCLLAAGAVVAVNAARISLIGLFPQHFNTLHGPLGSAVAAWLTLGLILAICLAGVRRETFAHR